MAIVRIKSGGFRIENDFAHQGFFCIASIFCVARVFCTARARNCAADVFDLSKSVVQAVAGLNHEIGLCTLFRIRHLTGMDGFEFLLKLIPGRARTRSRCKWAGAETTMTASMRFSPPVSNRSGISSMTRFSPAFAAPAMNSASAARTKVMERLLPAAGGPPRLRRRARQAWHGRYGLRVVLRGMLDRLGPPLRRPFHKAHAQSCRRRKRQSPRARIV